MKNLLPIFKKIPLLPFPKTAITAPKAVTLESIRAEQTHEMCDMDIESTGKWQDVVKRAKIEKLNESLTTVQVRLN